MDAVEERSSGASGSVVDKEDPVAVADCVGVADVANTVFISDPECNSFSGSALTVVLVMVALWFSCSSALSCAAFQSDRYSPTKRDCTLFKILNRPGNMWLRVGRPLSFMGFL